MESFHTLTKRTMNAISDKKNLMTIAAAAAQCPRVSSVNVQCFVIVQDGQESTVFIASNKCHVSRTQWSLPANEK